MTCVCTLFNIIYEQANIWVCKCSFSMVSSILLVGAGFSLFWVDSSASFLCFMSHLFLSWCTVCGVNVSPPWLCVQHRYVSIMYWWLGEFQMIITSQRVYFIRLKLDLSCHLHVKHPLLLGFVSLRIISVAFIWENACSESGVPNVMVQGKWLLSDLSSLTKHLSLLSHFAVVGHPSWF